MSTDLKTLEQIVTLIKNALSGVSSIVCIDGPAGSGKTTLAAQLSRELNAQTIHMDDLYEGWDGLEVGVQTLADAILSPFSQGKIGKFKRFDWELNNYAEEHQVLPDQWLIVEGCASATKLVDKYEPFIVWVEAPDDVRLERGLIRDGKGLREHWLKFMEDEERIYLANQTRQRADLRIDGFGNVMWHRAM